MARSLLLIMATFVHLSANAIQSSYLVGTTSASATTTLSAMPKSLQSFKEWKTQKIQQVQNRVDWDKAKIEQKKQEMAQKRSPSKTEAQLSRELGITQLEQQFKNDAYSLEMANELTVSDYFAAYLNAQPNKKEAFKEVAGKMSVDEVADLMNAYANSVFSSQGISVPVQAQDVSSEKIK